MGTPAGYGQVSRAQRIDLVVVIPEIDIVVIEVKQDIDGPAWSGQTR